MGSRHRPRQLRHLRRRYSRSATSATVSSTSTTPRPSPTSASSATPPASPSSTPLSGSSSPPAHLPSNRHHRSSGGIASTVYFTAGLANQAHGLFGGISNNSSATIPATFGFSTSAATLTVPHGAIGQVTISVAPTNKFAASSLLLHRTASVRHLRLFVPSSVTANANAPITTTVNITPRPARASYSFPHPPTEAATWHSRFFFLSDPPSRSTGAALHTTHSASSPSSASRFSPLVPSPVAAATPMHRSSPHLPAPAPSQSPAPLAPLRRPRPSHSSCNKFLRCSSLAAALASRAAFFARQTSSQRLSVN